MAVASFYSMTRNRAARRSFDSAGKDGRRSLPRRFWLFTAGVGLSGLGDFSRTFLILPAAAAFAGFDSPAFGESMPTGVLFYTAHNGISALAAFPAGLLGDRGSKLRVLTVGYGLGVVTNVLLAFSFGAPWLLLIAILLSGVYIAAEETLEKAVAAEMLPREQRSLGLGILASANAVGDMLSSVGVGLLLAAGFQQTALLIPAAFGLAGTGWMIGFDRWQKAKAARGGRDPR